MMSSTWHEALTQAGYKLTQPRRAVIEVLRETAVPLGPNEILDLGQAVHAELGLVTVYRTVAILEELGLLRRIHLGEGCHAFQPASPGHHHAVVCRKCGRAVEFDGDDDLTELVARVQRETGYAIDEHLLQLAGLCPECRTHALDKESPK